MPWQVEYQSAIALGQHAYPIPPKRPDQVPAARQYGGGASGSDCVPAGAEPRFRQRKIRRFDR